MQSTVDYTEIEAQALFDKLADAVILKYSMGDFLPMNEPTKWLPAYFQRTYELGIKHGKEKKT